MRQDVRRVLWSGGLAVLGLGLAAWAWKGDTKLEVSAGKVPLLACGSGELEELALVAGPRRVSVRFAAGRATVSLTRPVARGVLPPGGVTPTETLAMAANARVSRLRERYEPALAKRALGVVPRARLPALGLGEGDQPAIREHLEITCEGATRRFRVGTASYGGGGRYVQAVSAQEVDAQAGGAARAGRTAPGGAGADPGGDGRVWLVDPTLVSDVRLADSRYVERRLVAASRTELAGAEVRAYGKARTLTHLNRRVLKDAEWVDAAAPTQRNELYGNWLAKVLRLRGMSWLAKGAKPGQDRRPAVTTRPVMQVRFTGDVEVAVTLVRGRDAKGQALYWGRSESTGGWVTISRTLGQQIVDDLGAVVGAAPPAAARPSAPAHQAAPRPTAAAPNRPGAALKTPQPPKRAGGPAAR